MDIEKLLFYPPALAQRLRHKLLVGAGGVEARAGALGVLQFVGLQQEDGQKRPLAADEGLHCMHPAEVALHQEDTEAVVGHGEAEPGDGGLHIGAAEILHGHGQQFGHGLHFLGLNVDTTPAGAAIAALLAVEDGRFSGIAGHSLCL
jgi:hypothetical protein